MTGIAARDAMQKSLLNERNYSGISSSAAREEKTPNQKYD